MKKHPTLLGPLFILIVIGLLFTGCNTPETWVYLGGEVPKKYMEEVMSLGLLEKDEEMEYFYSDGLFDIKEGFYFVTDQKLVAYSEAWEEPKTVIPYGEIRKLDFEHNSSLFKDSYILVETKDDMFLEFPVSSEKKRDRAFFNFLREKTK